MRPFFSGGIKKLWRRLCSLAKEISELCGRHRAIRQCTIQHVQLSLFESVGAIILPFSLRNKHGHHVGEIIVHHVDNILLFHRKRLG